MDLSKGISRRIVLAKGLLADWLSKLAEEVQFGVRAFNFAQILGIVTLNRVRQRAKVQRASVLWEEAERRGIEMKELLLFGKPIDVYSAKRQAQNEKLNQNTFILFSGLPRPKRKSRRLVEEMDDKAKLKKLFKQHLLPVPEGGTAWNFWQAKKIFRRIQEVRGEGRERENFLLAPSIPVIVKPREGSRGRHTTTFVASLEDLKTAYDTAKRLCFWVVVEEQLFGPVYRATVVDFKVRGVLRGDHPGVEGDGSSSVESLIAKKNRLRPERVGEIKIDENLHKYLHRQGLGLKSVLPAGRKVELSEKIGLAYGGSAVEELEICHPDNLELFVRAAKLVDDPLIGFDFIIPDITKSWKGQKCGFLEANSLPFINLHHDPFQGRPQNIAQYVWEMVGW
jgi:hypothetical protein